MKIIELLGIPGSGKSTLLPKIQKVYRKPGVNVFSSDEAICACIQKYFWLNFILKITSNANRIQCSVNLYKKFLQEKYQKLFMERNADLYRAIYFSLEDSSVNAEHQKKLMNQYIELGSRKEFFEDHLNAEDYVIFSEGFAGQVANLFTSEKKSADLLVIKRVLQLLPKIHLMIFIYADIALCTVRMMSGGRVDQLRNKNNLDVQKFMEHSKGIIDFTEYFLTKSGIKSLEIDNNDALERVEFQLEAIFNPDSQRRHHQTKEKQEILL